MILFPDGFVNLSTGERGSYLTDAMAHVQMSVLLTLPYALLTISVCSCAFYVQESGFNC